MPTKQDLGSSYLRGSFQLTKESFSRGWGRGMRERVLNLLLSNIRVHVLLFLNLLNDTGTLVNVLSHELECPCNKGIIYDEEKGDLIQKRREDIKYEKVVPVIFRILED